MKKLVKIVAGSLWAVPFMALAQVSGSITVGFGNGGAGGGVGQQTYLSNLIQGAKNLLDQLVVFLIALAVVWFIWNVIKYAMSNEEDGKEKAKSQMIWGIIAIAVIVSVWGLVAILQSIFGVNTSGAGDVTRLLPY